MKERPIDTVVGLIINLERSDNRDLKEYEKSASDIATRETDEQIEFNSNRYHNLKNRRYIG